MKIQRLSWLFLGILFSSNTFGAELDSLTISFTITQDRVAYEESDYGEPPQVAIWLEGPGYRRDSHGLCHLSYRNRAFCR